VVGTASNGSGQHVQVLSTSKDGHPAHLASEAGILFTVAVPTVGKGRAGRAPAAGDFIAAGFREGKAARQHSRRRSD
jgi:hypothetical protein